MIYDDKMIYSKHDAFFIINIKRKSQE